MPSVLLIDDEPRVGEALRFALSPHGYSVVQETGADAGRTRAAEGGIDCILLDVDLGGVDGLALCRELRADPQTARTPLILLSGLADARSTARGLEAGADDYITKPFTPAVLRARIQAQLRRAEG